MANNFLARVLLHGAPSTEYDRLHEHMRDKKFYPFIDSGAFRYHLPTGTYHSRSNESFDSRETAVREALEAAGYPVADHYTVRPVDGTSAFVMANSAEPYRRGGLRKQRKPVSRGASIYSKVKRLSEVTRKKPS